MFFHFLLISVSIFMTMTLNSFSRRLLISILFSFFIFPQRIALVLSFRTYIFVSFCLILCVWSYILHTSAISLSLESVALSRWYPLGPNSISHMVTKRGTPRLSLVWAACALLLDSDVITAGTASVRGLALIYNASG